MLAFFCVTTVIKAWCFFDSLKNFLKFFLLEANYIIVILMTPYFFYYNYFAKEVFRDFLEITLSVEKLF